MRKFFSSLLALLVLSPVLWAGPSRISTDKPEGYSSYASISIPLEAGKSPQLYDLRLAPIGDAVLNQKCESPSAKQFKQTRVTAGTLLRVNSYLISQNLFEAHSGFSKGPDALTFEQIKKTLDSSDSAEFLRLLTKLAEERRSSETGTEYNQIKSFQVHDNDPCTQIFFGTGMFEVSGAGLANGDPDIRYFVRSSDVLAGQAKLDLKSAKIEVLKSLSVYLLKRIDGDYQDMGDDRQNAMKPKIAQLITDAECEACHVTDQVKVGGFVAEMLTLFKTAPTELLDPTLESRIVLRKELCVLKNLAAACGSASLMARVQPLIRAERIDCDRPRSLLLGLE